MKRSELPRLSPDELERLAVLSEELSEAGAAIGKTLRHGYDSCHPEGNEDNRDWIEREIGDVLAAIHLMLEASDLDESIVATHRDKKLEGIWKYLHHQPAWLTRKLHNRLNSKRMGMRIGQTIPFKPPLE